MINYSQIKIIEYESKKCVLNHSNAIDRIYGWYRDYENVQDCAKLVSLDDIESNDFNLHISLYVEKKIEGNLLTIKEALKNLKSSINGAVIAEDKMKKQLKEFGLLK